MLRKSVIATFDQLLLWGVNTFAFCGFLRASEFCASSNHALISEATLLSCLVERSNPTVILKLRTAKTDQMGMGTSVTLTQTKPSVCIVPAYLSYCRVRKPHSHPLLPFSRFLDEWYLFKGCVLRKHPTATQASSK